MLNELNGLSGPERELFVLACENARVLAALCEGRLPENVPEVRTSDADDEPYFWEVEEPCRRF